MAPTPDYTPQIITGVFSISGTLLGLVLGFALQRWAKGRDDRAQYHQEFFAIKIGSQLARQRQDFEQMFKETDGVALDRMGLENYS